MLRKLIADFVLLIAFASPAIAQKYKTALGFRGVLFSGISVKHYIGKNSALERITRTKWRGFDITGLHEIHNPALNIEKP
jgi:hypothetical protein